MPVKGKRGEFKTFVVVGIPTLGMVDIEFAMDLMRSTFPVNASPYFLPIIGKPVDEACNLIVETSLRLNADYIFFREDDVFIPQGSFEHLFARKVDIVSGVCMSKQIPPFPIIFKTYGGGPYEDWYGKLGELVEVCGVGVACTLIKTDVFRKIPPPWFKTIANPEAQEDVDDTVISRMTQDMFFYRRAIYTYGYKVWVDTGVQCGHKDVNTGNLYYYDPVLNLPAWLEPDNPKPKCISPLKRSLRVIEITDEEREKNLVYIKENHPELLEPDGKS